MKIQSFDREIKVLLASHFFKIPTFQRPYSWDNDNIDEFWDDVVMEGNINYFIGSMVTFRDSDNTYGIIDGQQRLTTITMLLCAIRNAFKDEGSQDLANALQQFVERIDVNAKLQYILQTETSFPYFQEHIQKSGAPILNPQIGEEEKKLSSAFRRLSNYIKQEITPFKTDNNLSEMERKFGITSKLSEIRDRILNLKVIFIDLDSEEDAFIAFETLNTRGKELEIADLVKSYLIRLIRPSNINVDTAKERWTEIVKNIESADQKMNDFLHDYWVSKYPYASPKGLYKAIKQNVNSNNSSTFLDDLLAASRIYRVIFTSDNQSWAFHESGIKSSLGALKTFRVKQHMPILLAILRAYDGKILKKRHVEQYLRVLENFHFVFTAVVSERANKARKEFFAKFAKQLTSNDDPQIKINILREFHKELKSKLPSLVDFQLNFQRLRYTQDESKQKPLIHYILTEINKFHLHNSGLVIDHKQMTIEHIAPENPQEETTIVNVGQIGNLILVEGGYNTHELGNLPFNEKLTKLKTSKVHLDDQLTQASEWDDNQIVKRTENLSLLAYNEIWNV